ncbi:MULTISPECIES: S8 family serine peptidase [Pseudomonas]|uniref:S8 family serine peptidase n=1 Tax=Pseudomonas quercus TaxID=2722792 RepID=A0ABX0YL49_9PSED|nr:S8 family serine peptidase [Pseudomonas sp. LY10J]MBF7144485.1 S8 family serine peptidase [Pseudomonas sp. LY10J]NJP03024.1 S8 family serine peptidase [Pseudomonas quercus]
MIGWISRIGSPRTMSALSNPILDEAATLAQDSANQLLTLAPYLVPDEELAIFIKNNPLPRNQTKEETETAQSVRDGYAVSEATHQALLSRGALDKTDFLSSQIASLTTGGVRPGEIQVDPNVKPNEYLQQTYIDKGAACTPLERLQNSLIFNNLGANTTHNVYVDPLLLDLTGQGVQMVSIADGVVFDIDNSGTLKRTGWAGAGTGLLVLDDGSETIRHGGQLISEYLGGKPGELGQPGEVKFPDAFAALASLDSNGDGLITAADAQWQHLRVWADENRSGSSEPGELKTLDDWSISEISVVAVVHNTTHPSGNTLRSSGTFTIDGQQREALAVNFLSDAVSHRLHEEGQGKRIESSTAEVKRISYVTNDDTGVTLDAQTLGVQTVQGGLGNDTLKAGPEGSWLIGGGGDNRYEGNIGDDVFLISASDDTTQINGGGGRDSAIVVGDRGVSLNLAKSGLMMAQGGRGHDVLIAGGNYGVFMKGGAAGSTLIGGGGNDVLVGGESSNIIVGGAGKSVIYAGPGNDLIFGSAQGSIIFAGAGKARITGRDADDVIEAGKGNATIDGGGGTNLVTLHGDHGDYVITPIDNGYRIEDKVAGRDGTLTLTRIQKLNFADISAVNLGGPNAMPVTDTVRTDAAGAPLTRREGARVIAAAALLANDQPMGSQGPLRISEVSDGLGGTAVLNEQGDVVFTPNPASQGAMGFKYALVDAAGNPAMNVVSLKTGEMAPMRGEVHLLTDQAPTDPLAARQWYLGDVGVLPVWEQYSGKGVRVGIFEPGGEFAVEPETFDIHHPDLTPNVDPGWLAAQCKAGTLPTQFSNHATQVAGVVAAARDGQGAVGVAPGVTLGGHYLANRGDDLTSLSNTSHYDVANNSWGFTTDFALTNLTSGSITTETALMLNAQYAARNGRGGLGTVMVTAGGNGRAKGGSAQGSLTNSHRHAIQVGAINAQGDLSTLNVGAAPFSNPGTSLLVSAPGSNVLSTSRKLDTERGSVFGSDYSATQGTSFAAPIVSGIAALMLEANPSLGYRDVQRILALSATYVADPTTHWAYNGAKAVNGGGLHKSDDYGFGKVDARAAVRMAESWPASSTLANEQSVGVINTPVNLAIGAGQSVRSEHVLTAGVKVEHIEVDIYSEVGQLGDLQLRLTSPAGTQSLLLDRAGKKRSGEGAGDADRGSDRAGAFNYTFTSTQHWGEYSQGAWTLEAVNAADGKPITLTSWGMRAYGEAASADDQYVYTDEFATLAMEPGRAVLDDAVNGTPGGNNTLNAAALSGDVNIDLQQGSATLAGRALSIMSPASMAHVITGDGNDTLIASSQGTVLEGGRGANTLVGGAGKDLFVVRQRAGGQDRLEGFEAARGELINLSGVGVTAFTELAVTQADADTQVSLPNGQRITLANTQAASVSADHFRFDRQVKRPEGYFAGEAPVTPVLPAAGVGEVVLSGGGKGVGLNFGPSGAEAKLLGTVYERSEPGPATFIAARQEGETNLRNALRGFNPSTDKIDLAQLGISHWGELVLEKQKRIVINGLALANGTSIKTAPNAEGKFIDVMYIDGLDPSQLAEQHFVFAPAGSAPYLPDPKPAMAQALVSVAEPAESIAALAPASLVQAIAAFAPEAAGSTGLPWDLRQPTNVPLMAQVA